MTDLFGHIPAPERVPLAGWPARPPGGFRTIYADPPWKYVMRSPKGEGRSPSAHYRCWPVEAIAAMPVAQLAAKHAVLFMWCTWPLVAPGRHVEVIRGWGFEPVTGACWAKRTPRDTDWSMGTGYWYRSASEPLILATRGQPSPQSRRTRNLVVAPVQQHSRKPDAVYADIEEIYFEPRLELFARTSRPGWTSWGDEAGTWEAAP